MTTTSNTKALVCGDCRMPILYGDFSDIDFHYSGDEAESRVAEIEQGITSLTESIGILSDGDGHDEFSKEWCDCCGTKLAGERFVIIGTEIIEASAA